MPTTLCRHALHPLLLLLFACEPEEDLGAFEAPAGSALATAVYAPGEAEEDADPPLTQLTLETRDGSSATGWSFAEGALVEAERADLVLMSWDCGARGRWVQLRSDHVDLCTVQGEGMVCTRNLEIGGSDPTVEIDDVIVMRLEDGTEYEVVLVDRTDTPFDWYEADDLGFEVTLMGLALARD